MSEINGQTDDVALLVNWFFCRPFPPYENLKVDKALGVEAVSNRRAGGAQKGGGGHDVVINFIHLQVFLFCLAIMFKFQYHINPI